MSINICKQFVFQKLKTKIWILSQDYEHWNAMGYQFAIANHGKLLGFF